MGEKQNEPFQFTFNRFLKVAFQGSRVTSDAGLILVRELDERLGLETFIVEHLSDSRQGLNTQFRLADLLRQSVHSRLAGYEDLRRRVNTSRSGLTRPSTKPEIYEALEKRGGFSYQAAELGAADPDRLTVDRRNLGRKGARPERCPRNATELRLFPPIPRWRRSRTAGFRAVGEAR